MERSLLVKYNSKYKEILRSLILENMKGEAPVHILDVGCGKGDDLLRISFINKDKRGYGIDISFDFLKIASRKLEEAKKFQIVQAEAEALPFKGESFDIVISSEVIEHVEQTQRFVEELYRVLKHQGVLIVTTPSRFNYPTLIGKIVPSPLKRSLRKFVYYLPQFEDGNPHFHEYIPRELKEMFQDNGFIIERIESGVLRVPIWPLFDRFPFLVLIWGCLDRFVDKLPFGIYLKLNFIIAGRKMVKK